MASEVELTHRELLADAAAVLRAAGLPQARREAIRLWSEVTGEGPATAILQPGVAAGSRAADAFRDAVARRAGGEPLAHVAGRTGFRRLTLKSDRRGLIPRPETEGLVDLLLARVRTGRVVDVGAGSGCLALSLAAEGSFSHIVGVDRSAEALALARENQELVGARLDLLQGDLCAPLRCGVFDALVSNPPYLSDAEYAALDGAVKQWEPREALVGGTDGLDVTRRLLDQARRLLRPNGWLALEIDCTRAARCASHAGELGWADVAIHADLFGRERYLLARRSPTQ
ncbi:MAG: peptide chain release factor N(5)-glutamine methyltransferase [Gemmatimonadales bacterium]|nr:peptide chain release factor N(5)-glutamine methyltransferase [Gemmatimonadales bacterium]